MGIGLAIFFGVRVGLDGAVQEVVGQIIFGDAGQPALEVCDTFWFGLLGDDVSR